MAAWPYRYQLSFRDRLRRSVYEVLRDQMDIYLIKYAMIDSYRKFKEAGEPYPFVPKRELKPRARVVERTEYSHQNNFLVLFCEGSIPNEYKRYIRFFDNNKLTKESIAELVQVRLHKSYTRNLRYFEHPGFERFLVDLLPVDYALLIQQDQTIRKRNRYVLSHFHVRIDWPVDEATQDMAQELRYISKDLYESGEQYAQRLNYKLFERHGYYHVVGGRRTAAVVAAQLLRKMDFISTVYAASSEGRSLSRLSERGMSKFVLIKLTRDEISQLVADSGLKHNYFAERYLIDVEKDHGVAILQIVHRNSIYSKPPEDGKRRKLRPDYQWLTISNQLLVPVLDYHDTEPLPFSTVYTTEPC